jgi:deoxyhypusine synthase
MSQERSQPVIRNRMNFADGSTADLEPLSPLDLSKVAGFSDLLTHMSRTAFAGRQLGVAADILTDMARDPDCLVVGTVSGAMTMAQMGLLLTDMIEHRLLDIVVTTGAMLSHGLVEERGGRHYKCPEKFRDSEFFDKGIDRVYDTLELEVNLEGNEQIVKEVVSEQKEGHVFCSHDLLRRIGEKLNARHAGRGILQAAARRDVPVFVPAFSDSEMGMIFAMSCKSPTGPDRVDFDPFLDLDHYTALVSKAKRLGIFTIGGGVPRNWAQQIGPYAEFCGMARTGKPAPMPRFQYGVRICPEPAHWGGLSGCTYAEGVSWGKFVSTEQGGRFAEVHVDATVGWPILLAAVFERLGIIKKPS